MNFHDSRGMLEAIAEWMERYYVEIDWEAVMQCKWWVGPKDWVPPPKWSLPPPWPERLTPRLASKLLFAQWWNGLSVPPELSDPLDDYEAPKQLPGGEGVDQRPEPAGSTGQSEWKIFLSGLARIRVEVVELKMVTMEERRALARYAMVEEYLRKEELAHNAARVRRQRGGEAIKYMSRKAVPGLVERARRGNLEAIGELERRGWDAKVITEWRRVARVRAEKGRIAAAKRYGRGEAIVGAIKEGVEAIRDGVCATGSGRVGIERELTVIRVGPNPRILTCKYMELASERICLVKVVSIKNFVKGMKFRMREPLEEDEYRNGWEYGGVLPKFRGRW